MYVLIYAYIYICIYIYIYIHTYIHTGAPGRPGAVVVAGPPLAGEQYNNSNTKRKIKRNKK